jgi:hypothetical protein
MTMKTGIVFTNLMVIETSRHVPRDVMEKDRKEKCRKQK